MEEDKGRRVADRVQIGFDLTLIQSTCEGCMMQISYSKLQSTLVVQPSVAPAAQ